MIDWPSFLYGIAATCFAFGALSFWAMRAALRRARRDRGVILVLSSAAFPADDARAAAKAAASMN